MPSFMGVGRSGGVLRPAALPRTKLLPGWLGNRWSQGRTLVGALLALFSALMRILCMSASGRVRKCVE